MVIPNDECPDKGTDRMIDYLFIFPDEATAKTALPSYWIAVPSFAWDPSRILAPTGNGSTAPLQAFMGTDVLNGYPLALALPVVSDAIWAISQCMLEGDRSSASILRTRFDAAQMQGISTSPVMAGTDYIFQGQGVNLVIDQAQHPISDSTGTIVDGGT